MMITKKNLKNFRSDKFDYIGRIFSKQRVLSFFVLPENKNKLKTLIDQLNKELYKERIHFKINYNNWFIELSNNILIPLSKYKNAEQGTLNEIATLNGQSGVSNVVASKLS